VRADLPRIQPLTPERSRILGADPARERLLDQIMYAATHEEIGVATQAQLAWLRANPDDFGVLQAGEDLAYAFDSLCVKLLLATGYEFLPPTGDVGEDSLLRRKGGAPGQRLALDCIWTYVPAGVRSIWTVAEMVRDLQATEGLLITGAGLTDEAHQLAQRLGIRVIDGDELKRLIDTHAPELNEPTEPADWEVELGLRPRAETDASTQSQQPAEPTRRQ
jgi:hypothetical protein